MVQRLPELNSDFQKYQFAILEQLEDGQDESGEHDVMDEHEDKIDDLTYHLSLLRTIHKSTEPRTLSENKTLR